MLGWRRWRLLTLTDVVVSTGWSLSCVALRRYAASVPLGDHETDQGG